MKFLLLLLLSVNAISLQEYEQMRKGVGDWPVASRCRTQAGEPFDCPTNYHQGPYFVDG